MSKLVIESLNEYYDNISLEILNESLITEKFDLNKVKSAIYNISDKGTAFTKYFNKFKQTADKVVKKRLALILLLIYFIGFASATNKWKTKELINDPKKMDTIASAIVNDEKAATVETYKEFSKRVNDLKEKLENRKDPTTLTTSEEGINLIKHHEKLKLKGYKIGDGRITIGWGHSEPIKSSKYKVGQAISKEEAEQLFKRDLKRAENSVKRIFKQWKEQDINVALTQEMFDAMVSMTFNMGNKGMRTSKFIQHVKKGDLDTAAEAIKNTRVSDKFPGLVKRRNDEYKLFLGKKDKV